MSDKRGLRIEDVDFRELRRKLGRTQVEMARDIGVSLMAYQLWERGAMRPSVLNARKILELAEKAGG